MIKKLLKKLAKIIPDKLYLKISFKMKTGYKLNLKEPKTFNEKLQWLKLYGRNHLYTKLADKYEVREYIKDKIGEEYLIPLLGVYNTFDEINFDELPNEFVIKCNHDCASVVICKDKKNFDYDAAKGKIEKALKRNYYYGGREWVYKNIKPRIIIEKCMEDASGQDLKDYKFFCFNGVAKMFKIDFNRFKNHQANYYDVKTKKILPFGEFEYPPDYNKKIAIPKNIDKMIKLANQLSKDIPFARVDFYNINEKIYFGEITFYPAAGFGKFTSKEWDYKLGEMLELPDKKNK